ncbi:hypothetical protein [Ralstonia pseudosolanacearum]
MSDTTDAEQLRAMIARMPPGMQRAYLSLYTEVREYAIQLVDEVKQESGSGEPLTESGKIKTSVAERLLHFLTESSLRLKDDVEHS